MSLEKTSHLTIHRVNTGREFDRAERAIDALKGLFTKDIRVHCELDLNSIGSGSFAFVHDGLGDWGRKIQYKRGMAGIIHQQMRRFKDSEFVDGVTIELKHKLDKNLEAVLQDIIDTCSRKIGITLSTFSVQDIQALAELDFPSSVLLQQLLFTNPLSVAASLRKKIRGEKVSDKADQVVTWRPKTMAGYDEVGSVLGESLDADFYAGSLNTKAQLETNLASQVSSSSRTAGGYIDLHGLMLGWKTELGRLLLK